MKLSSGKFLYLPGFQLYLCLRYESARIRNPERVELYARPLVHSNASAPGVSPTLKATLSCFE